MLKLQKKSGKIHPFVCVLSLLHVGLVGIFIKQLGIISRGRENDCPQNYRLNYETFVFL